MTGIIKGQSRLHPSSLSHTSLPPPHKAGTNSHLALSVEVYYTAATKLPPQLRYGANALSNLLKSTKAGFLLGSILHILGSWHITRLCVHF